MNRDDTCRYGETRNGVHGSCLVVRRSAVLKVVEVNGTVTYRCLAYVNMDVIVLITRSVVAINRERL